MTVIKKMLLKINTIGFFFFGCNEITEHLRKFCFTAEMRQICIKVCHTCYAVT